MAERDPLTPAGSEFIPPVEPAVTYPRGAQLRQEIEDRAARGQSRFEIEEWLTNQGMDPGDATVVVDMVLPSAEAPPLPGIQPYEVWYVKGTTNADVSENYQAQSVARRRRAAMMLGLVDDQPNPELAVTGDWRPVEHIRADRPRDRLYIVLVMIPLLLLGGLVVALALTDVFR